MDTSKVYNCIYIKLFKSFIPFPKLPQCRVLAMSFLVTDCMSIVFLTNFSLLTTCAFYWMEGSILDCWNSTGINSNWFLETQQSWCSFHCVTSFPSVCSRPSDKFLRNIIQYSGMWLLQKDTVAFPLCLAFFPPFSLTHFKRCTCYAVRCLTEISTYSSTISAAVIKHSNQKQLRVSKSLFGLQFHVTVHYWGKSAQELKQDIETIILAFWLTIRLMFS